jgi:hypothetical protein
MSKIWIYSPGYGKETICYKERDLLTKMEDRGTIKEYDLVSESSTEDYLKARERDAQLRSVLDELSPAEIKIRDFINHYEKIAPDGTISYNKSTEKERKLKTLKKLQLDSDKFKYYITTNLKYFYEISYTKEWILSILKVKNFQKIDIGRVWDQQNRKYVTKKVHEDLQKAFDDAKIELKKIKKK